LQVLHRAGLAHRNQVRSRLQRLPGEQFDLRSAGRERDHPEPVRLRGDDV
jgi:hypothetical protein